MHLIIDGYNMIRQCPDLEQLDRIDLQSGRDALIARLTAYKRLRNHRMTIVFDGAGDPAFHRDRTRIGGITIIFSHAGETADRLISDIVATEGPDALVVSSDRAVMADARRQGADAVPVADFSARLEMALAMNEDTMETAPVEGWAGTTKKRGPSRRLPKKQRRQKRRIKDL